MMTISFSCDECGKHYEVSPSLAGKRGQCKQCGHRMLIPKPALVTAGGEGAGGRDPYGLEDVSQGCGGSRGIQCHRPIRMIAHGISRILEYVPLLFPFLREALPLFFSAQIGFQIFWGCFGLRLTEITPQIFSS